jgi:hypothetical protein
MAGSQLSLLSRGPLFDPQVSGQYVTEMRGRTIPQEAARAKALKKWVDALAGASMAKESELEQAFNQKVLCEVLGYELYPGATASAWPKPPSNVTGIRGVPDVALGKLEPDTEPEFLAVLELKTPGTDLNEPQARERALTPVQQAFEYGEQVLGVRWVLVSDMRIIRLYSVESPHEYTTFDLTQCVRGETPMPEFRELYWFLSRECLVDGANESPVAMLLAKSVSRQLAIKDSFYDAYERIRADLLTAIKAEAEKLDPPPTRQEILQSTQRLLDRMLFLYYCEDNPERLIPSNTVPKTTEAARQLPGASSTKVYEYLKLLFREIDEGSPPSKPEKLSAYNGELFKPDPIIDIIDVPDSLHDKRYPFKVEDQTRYVKGVWGLHEFDFWTELNEHLLGHIFEKSLSDMEALSKGQTLNPDRLRERRQHGIYYTSELLSDYLSESALDALTREAEIGDPGGSGVESLLEARQKRLGALRIVDMACGSGAFLVSSYQALLEELLSATDALTALKAQGAQGDLFTMGETVTQARLLSTTLYGADLLPQATEIAKLALWLRSARKDEKVADLSSNIVATNSLNVPGLLAAMNSQAASFDLVVGNPPWGAEVEPDLYEACCMHLGIDAEPEWDSWELFVHLGLSLLRDGGRLAFVLPDTLFSPEKERARRLILTSGAVEYIHNIGTDWFANVRMGSVLLQVRRGTRPTGHTFKALLLSGTRRREAIAGEVPLKQLVARFGRDIPQDRCLVSPTAEIEVFRSTADDALIDEMVSHSSELAALTTHGRGEEMAKTGMLWICPSCTTATVPARKKKADPDNSDGPKYHSKECPGCELVLTEDNVSPDYLVRPAGQSQHGAEVAPYIDGDDIARRYLKLNPTKELRLDFKGFSFKDEKKYTAPKLLIRQAGVGLMATLDDTGARVPQSVYWYRLTPQAQEQGYKPEFLLAVLLSRTMAYYIFKRFGEVDPARAHAKVTHERLRAFPIPKVDFDDREQRKLHDDIVASVTALLAGDAEVGGPRDMQIDVALRKLWGLSPEDGMHILLELAELPAGQVIRELYPDGVPKQILKPADDGSPDEFEVATPGVLA